MFICKIIIINDNFGQKQSQGKRVLVTSSLGNILEEVPDAKRILKKIFVKQQFNKIPGLFLKIISRRIIFFLQG